MGDVRCVISSTTVEIIAWDDGRAAGSVSAERAVGRIVAAPNASARASWLKKLDIVIISHAGAPFRVTLAIVPSTRIVLASAVSWIQTIKSLGPDTARELGPTTRSSPGFVFHIAPKVGGQCTLQR